MGFPLTLDEYLHAVAKETARMSWPKRMSAILAQGTKNDAEAYFTSDIFLASLKRVWMQKVHAYDPWHKARVDELGRSIAAKVKKHNARGTPTGYREEVVAAKLIDTFMHRLMKCEECRPLWTRLHLPLDRKIFGALRALAADSRALRNQRMSRILAQNPYTMTLKEHQFVQKQLRKLLCELNCRPNMEFKLTSPVQLNILWADGHKT